MSPTQRLPLGLEIGLLGFLRPGPSYGYQILQDLRAPGGLGMIWRIKPSQLYALLDRLEDIGLLSSKLEVQETRPARKLLTLTASGETCFLEWMAAPVGQPREFRQEYLAKLYFARQEGEVWVEQLIAAQQARCAGWIEHAQSELDNAREKLDGFAFEVFRYRLEQVQAIASYLRGRQGDVDTGSTFEQEQGRDAGPYA